MGEMRNALDLYFGGDTESSIAPLGRVAGRIDSIKPVAQVIEETTDAVITSLFTRYYTTVPA
jgi:enoyl-[acyl-carrier protein] reductase II